MTSRPLLTLLALGASAMSMCQAPQDLPSDHWSRTAIENLYNKVLSGHPGSSFKGGSLTTRYEMASALYRLIRFRLEGITSAEGRLAERQDDAAASTSGSSPDLAQPLKDVSQRLDRIEAGSLKLLVMEFETELASLGVDVDGLQSALDIIRRRLEALETAPAKIRVSGDATFSLLGAASSDRLPVLTSSGHVLGLDGSGAPRGLEKNFLLLHDVGISFSGDIRKNVHLLGVMGAGSSLGAYRSFSGDAQGRLADRGSEAYIQSLNVTLDGKLARGESKATLGRFGHSVPLIFERIDNTPFLKSKRWDSSDYLVDGFRMAMNWPGSELDVFGGRLGSIQGMNGALLTAPVIRSFRTRIIEADTALGASLKLQANSRVLFKGGYMYLEGNKTLGAFPYSVNRMISLGGSAAIRLPHGAGIEGGVAKNILKDGSRTTVDNQNETFYANLSIPFGSSNFEAGYQRREHNSFLNGDWGRFGAVINPTGYTGIHGALKVPAPFGAIKARVDSASGIDRKLDVTGTAGLDQGDKLSSWSLEADVRLRGGWNLTASYSDTLWKLAKAEDPYSRFLTLAASSSTGYIFGIQLSDADSKAAAFLKDQGLGGRFRGAVIFSQATVRF